MYTSDYEFAINLFNVDMDKREEWLDDMEKKQGVLKKAAIKNQIRKVRYGE